MASTKDASLFSTNTFHDWWLGELRSSLAPTAIDAKPPEPPEAPRAPTRPLPVLFFACTLGLVGGAATMLLLDTRTASPGVTHAAVAPEPEPVVEGIVEIGEIIVVSTPAEPQHERPSRTSKQR